MQGTQGRIKYLDGLRGIAILLVLLSHYWGLGWTAILPFGDKFGSTLFVRQGWVGVELFFLISGFVILITIERCRNVGDFLYRRWLRLFPAMLVATLVTLAFNWTIQPVSQFAESPWFNALPGLTFVPPAFYHMIFDVDIDSLHRSFWSLYTEVSFYVLFGVSFFLMGWKRATVLIAAIGLTVLFAYQILVVAGVTGIGLRLAEPFNWLGIKFFLWFASGILFAKSRTLGSDWLFYLACAVGLASAVLISPNSSSLKWDDSLAMTAVVALFATAQKWRTLQNLLQLPPILFLGAISYPLYLIHETIGLGLIVVTHRYAPWIPDILLPLPTSALMIAVAYWMTYQAEPKLRSLIERMTNSQRSRATSLV